jgi:hypothetical protein
VAHAHELPGPGTAGAATSRCAKALQPGAGASCCAEASAAYRTCYSDDCGQAALVFAFSLTLVFSSPSRGHHPSGIPPLRLSARQGFACASLGCAYNVPTHFSSPPFLLPFGAPFNPIQSSPLPLSHFQAAPSPPTSVPQSEMEKGVPRNTQLDHGASNVTPPSVAPVRDPTFRLSSLFCSTSLFYDSPHAVFHKTEPGRECSCPDPVTH